MKVCGLITEYNPFHNGHIQHLKEAREKTGADFLLVCMSGDFVQRGVPAIIDKYERTKMALNAGADLILEIPSLFATSSAEVFAYSAISMLEQLGSVDYVCFGSELGDVESLKPIAHVLNHEPKAVSNKIQDSVKSGMSYPGARAFALSEYFADEIEGIDTILSFPNNILGIEYLRAIEKMHSKIEPFSIKRWTSEYHDEWATFKNVASATTLRRLLYEEENGLEKITPYVSPFTSREFNLQFGMTTPIHEDDLSSVLQYALTMNRDHLEDYLDFSSEMRDKVLKTLPDTFTFSEWGKILKSKNLVHTRINRAFLHLILQIKQSELDKYKNDDYCLYAKILGFRTDAAPLLSKIKRNTALPIISKMADAKKILPQKGLDLLNIDLRARDLYRNLVYQKFGTAIKDDFTNGIIKI